MMSGAYASCCKDPLSAMLGLATSEHPSATCLRFSLPPSPSMLVHCLLLKHWCKIPTNESHLFLPSQPPASPLLHFIFYTFSCPSGATTPSIPTPYQHHLLFSTDYDLIVGTLNVYKLPSFKDGWSIPFLCINLVVFSLP